MTSKIDKGIIQQLVFRDQPNTNKVLVGAKVSDQWFSFGLYETKEEFPLESNTVVSFEYEEGESFGLVNLNTVNVHLDTGDGQEGPEGWQESKDAGSDTNTKVKNGVPKNSSQEVSQPPKKAKLYGTVTAIISDNVVGLDDDKLGIISVKLADKQLKDLSKLGAGSVVNTRFTGFCECNSEGCHYEVKSGFKAYQPIKTKSDSEMVEKISSIQDAPFNSKERQFKMSVGNIMNVAAIACDYNMTETVKFAEELFPEVEKLRVELINKYKDTRSDSDISSKLGDCLKHAAQSNMVVIDLIDEAKMWVEAHVELEHKLSKNT